MDQGGDLRQLHLREVHPPRLRRALPHLRSASRRSRNSLWFAHRGATTRQVDGDDGAAMRLRAAASTARRRRSPPCTARGDHPAAHRRRRRRVTSRRGPASCSTTTARLAAEEAARALRGSRSDEGKERAAARTWPTFFTTPWSCSICRAWAWRTCSRSSGAGSAPAGSRRRPTGRPSRSRRTEPGRLQSNPSVAPRRSVHL